MPSRPPVTVRPARAVDLRAVAEIRVQAWRSAYAGIVPQPYLDAMSVEFEENRRRAALHDASNPTRILVAESAGAAPDRGVTGFVVIGPSRDDDGVGIGEVHALYVRPGDQRRGVGRALLDRAVADLRVTGYRRATLWVLEANAPARGFYERWGWRADGTRHVYTKTGADLPELRYAVPLT